MKVSRWQWDIQTQNSEEQDLGIISYRLNLRSDSILSDHLFFLF